MNDSTEICGRLREVRIRTFGSRGKAQFAKRLGIRASTYQQYELNRVPPADLLVRAAQITRCDLLWLLTGDSFGSGSQTEMESRDAPLVERVRDLVRRRPETAQGLAAFVALIDPRPPHAPEFPAVSSITDRRDMIPVAGSTAAGPARFWKEIMDVERSSADVGEEANARLQQLLEQLTEPVQCTEGRLSLRGSSASAATVSLVQFSRPDDRGIVEFLSCPTIAAEHPPLIAWRIDGDSMAPRYGDGDFILVSPSDPAAEGHPCVAHQRGQLGVNCKIFQRDGSDVVLIPVNEQYALQRFPAAELVWAHRVQFSVRLKR